MNFYLDFEATQFTEEIISIGCVSENGATFRQLVWPAEFRHITNFITNLTGLTKEMVKDEGVCADEAFLRFRDFVKEQSGNEVPSYFCYGNMDKVFIHNTMKRTMKDFNAIIFAGSVSGLLTDYAVEVKHYLSVQGIALKKLVMLVRHNEHVEQNHDSLDDALMLKECYGKLDEINLNSVEVNKVMAKPKEKKVKRVPLNFDTILPNIPGNIVFPEQPTKEDEDYIHHLRLHTWLKMSRNECPGDATPEEARVILTNIYKGDQKYFSSPLTAALFMNMRVRDGKSTKKMSILIQTAKAMFQSPNNFCGYRCELIERKEEGQN